MFVRLLRHCAVPHAPSELCRPLEPALKTHLVCGCVPSHRRNTHIQPRLLGSWHQRVIRARGMKAHTHTHTPRRLIRCSTGKRDEWRSSFGRRPPSRHEGPGSVPGADDVADNKLDPAPRRGSSTEQVRGTDPAYVGRRRWP